MPVPIEQLAKRIEDSGIPHPNFGSDIMRVWMAIAASAAIALVISGCPSDPNTDFYTTNEPKAADLAGRYVLTSQSVQSGGTARLEDKSGFIELHDDGTFTAINAPAEGCDPDDEKFFDRLVCASGTWKVSSVGSIANAGQTPKTHWGIGFSCENQQLMHAGLTGSAAPYGLLFTIGDPDRAKTLFYEMK